MSGLRLRIATVGVSVAMLISLIVAPGLFAGERSDSHYDAEIAALEEAIGHATDAETRASLEEKLAMARESRRLEIEARRQPVNAGTRTARNAELQREIEADNAQPPVHAPRIPAGAGALLNGVQPRLPKGLLLSTNHWLRVADDGSELYAYAGADPADREQGKLVVVSEGISKAAIVGQYPTPGRNGPVSVVGAEEMILELEAEDGTHFRFDLETLAYR